MAALESTGFVRFALPLSNASFNNRNTLWPAKPSRAIRSPTSSQKARRPAATPFRSGCQAEADRNTATSEGRQRALTVSDDESNDDLPSLEELSRRAPHPKISTEASKTESTAQRLEQPALDGAGLQVDRTQPGLGRRQGDSRDQPMVLDDDSDEAEEGTPGDVDTRRIGRDTSPHNTLATSELASGPTKSIDTSGPWYDVEEGCYIEERAPGLGPCEQQGVHSAPAQAQPQILPRSSQSPQDQINQQYFLNITESMPVESAPHSLPKLPDSGDDGWTDDSMAELETELGMALEEQGNSPSASTPRSAEPSHLQIDQEHDQSRTSNLRSEELILGTPLRSQDQGDKQQEAAGEKRGRQDRNEDIRCDNHHPKGGNYSHNTSDEDDEDPRPARRRKLTPTPTNNALTPPDEPTPVGKDHHHTPRTSRSPSTMVESTPVAEYREWPVQGFLKRTTIGDQTIYNLEFALPRTSEHFHLSLHSEVFGSVSGESPAKAAVSHRAVSTRKPGKELTKEQESLLAKMVYEDKTWPEIGRHFPGHRLHLLKENFFKQQGGKPRKRGRKRGVRGRGA
ncbi:hypothetical protein B0J14DRAFT_160406 [Halenospora varia]|nr:hypothetical protein B0J14DRAFT_160406 [Halenospora varia]